VFSGNNIIKVVATEDEIKDFKIGQKVLVASKAFNPIIQVIS
jgi:molybdate transport system ATP-binding protein